MFEKYMRPGDLVTINGESALPHILCQRDYNTATLSNGHTLPLERLRPYHLQPWQVARFIVTRYTILTVGQFMQKNRPTQQRKWIERYLKNPEFLAGMQIETGGEYVEDGDLKVFVTGVLDNLDEELRHCHVV